MTEMKRKIDAMKHLIGLAENCNIDEELFTLNMDKILQREPTVPPVPTVPRAPAARTVKTSSLEKRKKDLEKKGFYNIKKLADMLNIKDRELNSLLVRLGYQQSVKIGKRKGYQPTVDGLRYSAPYPNTKNVRTEKTVCWLWDKDFIRSVVGRQ